MYHGRGTYAPFCRSACTICAVDVHHSGRRIQQEFNIFNMQNIRMEYEANIFASQVALDDDEFLELCDRGYDTQQIASALHSDINLVALKADTLISQGYRLRRQEHRNTFLK